MVTVELRRGDAAKADKRAKDITTLYPKLAIGHSLQGDVAMAKGQPALAIEAYRRAHQAEPSTDTVMRLFRALSTQADTKPALQLAEQWLKTQPQDLRMRKALADGQARTGNFSLAKTSYEAVLKQSPDDVDVLNNLANVQLRLKDPAAVKTLSLIHISPPMTTRYSVPSLTALIQNSPGCC